jgi:hypothetical protein
MTTSGLTTRPAAAEDVPAEPTPADKLRALAAHLDLHPELGHLSSVNVIDRLHIQLYEPEGESAIGALLPWARSIGAVNVSASRAADWHITARGQTETGVAISVVALTRAAETGALNHAIGGSKLNGAVPLDVLARHQRPAPAAEDAHTAELHVLRESYWCQPENAVDGHRNEDGSPVVFAATGADPIIRDGYATEDHR